MHISALASLTNLTFLLLEGGQISDISPLLGLMNLERLDLLEIQLSVEQMAELREALPDAEMLLPQPS